MKNHLSLEASWWREFISFFRMSKFIFWCSSHILNFYDITKNPLPLIASWRAQLRTLVRMSKCINFMHLQYIRPLFRMPKFIIFVLPPYIRFMKYYEKSFTVGSILMSRIQNTFHNVEMYYFYAAAIYKFSEIIWIILYRWKRHDKQNLFLYSEGLWVLFLCSCYTLNF